MTPENMKRLNVVIPIEIHRELKIEVAKRDITIGEFVAECITEKLDRIKKGDND